MSLASLLSSRMIALPLRNANFGLYFSGERGVSHRNVDAEDRNRMADLEDDKVRPVGLELSLLPTSFPFCSLDRSRELRLTDGIGCAW